MCVLGSCRFIDYQAEAGQSNKPPELKGSRWMRIPTAAWTAVLLSTFKKAQPDLLKQE